MDAKELRILAALGARERRKALTAELEILNREFPLDGEVPAAKSVTKLHWTQTPAGRKKMAQIQKARYAKGGKK
jgi:hypothetical protein